MNWYRLTFDSAAATAHVFLSDDIGIDSNQTSGTLAAELAALSLEHLQVTVDSHGGDARTALNLADIFRRFERSDCLIIGQCWSAALIAATGCRTIKASSTATLMIHSPAAYCFGPAAELLDAAVDVERLCAFTHQLLRERTEQSPEIISQWLATDSYFTADAALEAGLIDEIVPPAEPRNIDLQATMPGNCDSLTANETEAEKMFNDWLTAFGPLEVSDKTAFGRRLQEWFQYHVKEADRLISNPQE